MNNQGTGLGLMVCKKLLTQMGASVTVKSKLGEGTRFIMNFQQKAKDKILLNRSQMIQSEIDEAFEIEKAKEFTEDFGKRFLK
jgi:nitrogen-specific signal transduction histidine kinase